MSPSLPRRLAAEGLGTAFLLAIIIGSGVMGERLAGGNIAIALLANSLATGFGLAALIAALGPVSGAHLNPLVSLSAAASGWMTWRNALAYGLVQLPAAIAGVIAAHLMFGLPWLSSSTHVRAGMAQAWSEFIATFGLVLLVQACRRQALGASAAIVAGYIAAAYWFTASTSFANPAVTLARCVSDTFAGSRPDDVAVFLGAQAAGAVAATLLARWLFAPPGRPEGG